LTGQKIGYVRVSSEDQNLDRQLEALKELNLDRIFQDKFSGKSTDRPALQEMLRFVREGDSLYIHSMDRLARNLVDLRNMVNDLTARGIKVIFMKENLTFTGTSEAVSVLLLSVMGAVAEFERSIIRERQSEGIRIAKQKGVYSGRVHALKSEQVAELRQMVESGIPKAKVAKKFGICRETVYRYLSAA
jgi:DNA invertase Pin-like site-specific DNA recombinase